MILSTLSQFSRYATLHPLFPRAFDYIRNTDLLALTPGVHDIIDKQLFVIVEEAEGRTRAEAKLECHRKYIDIQLVLAGIDEMGWKALSDCHQPIADYNSERDIQFFDDVPDSWIAEPADDAPEVVALIKNQWGDTGNALVMQKLGGQYQLIGNLTPAGKLFSKQLEQGEFKIVPPAWSEVEMLGQRLQLMLTPQPSIS